MKKLYGVTVAMITPLDDQDRIIESSVQEHVEFLKDRYGMNIYKSDEAEKRYALA